MSYQPRSSILYVIEVLCLYSVQHTTYTTPHCAGALPLQPKQPYKLQYMPHYSLYLIEHHCLYTIRYITYATVYYIGTLPIQPRQLYILQSKYSIISPCPLMCPRMRFYTPASSAFPHICHTPNGTFCYPSLTMSHIYAIALLSLNIHNTHGWAAQAARLNFTL